jgi:hypothetical protein
MPFLDRLRAATETAAARAKEELETLQKRRELTQAYADLGRKAFDRLETGALSEPSFAEDAERIRRLKAELEAAAAADAEPAE